MLRRPSPNVTSVRLKTRLASAARPKIALPVLAAALLAVLVVADRVLWASVANWGLDQAVNLWLGYVQPLDQIPIGLISSRATPNPNGMVLLAAFLSRLPGLWAVSAFLGCLQALLLVLLCQAWLGRSKLFWLVTAVLLSSAVLRAMSIEFWNQWIILYFNILFFLFLSWYLSKPALIKIPLLIFVVGFAPSLYLGGLSNAAAYVLLFVFALIRTRARLDSRRGLLALVLSVLVAGVLLAATWVPYLESTPVFDLLRLSRDPQNSYLRQVFIALITLAGFVGWNVTWTLRVIPSVVYFNGVVLPAPAGVLVTLHNFILVYLTFLSFLSLGYAGLSSYKKRGDFFETFLPGFEKEGQLIGYAYSFILLVFTLTPLLQGPFWINGERMDMTLQFLPFFLIIWFTAPAITRMPPEFHRLVRPLSLALGLVFIALNLVLGWLPPTSLRAYPGKVPVQYDIPLYQIREAARWIARDWSEKSGAREIPVYYEFEAAYPAYLKEIFGLDYTPWYPATPYTIGRAFDYELLRVYQLRNAQEGIPTPRRDRQPAEYILRYSFLPLEEPTGCYTEHIFDRLSILVRNHEVHGCDNQ